MWVRKACFVTFVKNEKYGDNNPNFEGFIAVVFDSFKKVN